MSRIEGKNEEIKEEVSDAQSELAPKKMKKETALTFLLGDDDNGVSSRGEEVDKFLQEKPVPSNRNGLEWWGKTQIVTQRYSLKPENVDMLIFLNKNSPRTQTMFFGTN